MLDEFIFIYLFVEKGGGGERVVVVRECTEEALEKNKNKNNEAGTFCTRRKRDEYVVDRVDTHPSQAHRVEKHCRPL